MALKHMLSSGGRGQDKMRSVSSLVAGYRFRKHLTVVLSHIAYSALQSTDDKDKSSNAIVSKPQCHSSILVNLWYGLVNAI